MMQNAAAWDDFLEYVQLLQEPWAAPQDDTDSYRKKRAVQFFNSGVPTLPAPPPSHADWLMWHAGNKVANHLIRLKPTLSGVMGASCHVLHRAKAGPSSG